MINTGARLAQSGIAFVPPPPAARSREARSGSNICPRAWRLIFLEVGFGCIGGAGSTPKVKLSPLAREVVGTLLKLRLRRHLPRAARVHSSTAGSF